VSIDRATVDYVANLARLALTDEERDRLTQQLGDILTHFATLQTLDTDAVEPTSDVVALVNIPRDDVPGPCLPRDIVLAAAPEAEDGYIKVPPVIEMESPP
jgi:aspartyl-tRNA(Asn)/glutamyl-tRNA(Gln) amidotransferase subunit C